MVKLGHKQENSTHTHNKNIFEKRLTKENIFKNI